MTHSPYATISALVVPCPACNAPTNWPCTSLSTDARKRGKPRVKAHPARRSAADDQRTAEVNDARTNIERARALVETIKGEP